MPIKNPLFKRGGLNFSKISQAKNFKKTMIKP
ncbi:hypothetical protein N408_06800 [Helicobacter pylori FD703]|nr:hypothetical protein N408_06800 [Helicobacter pylori FD703]